MLTDCRQRNELDDGGEGLSGGVESRCPDFTTAVRLPGRITGSVFAPARCAPTVQLAESVDINRFIFDVRQATRAKQILPFGGAFPTLTGFTSMR
ncbi:hypothetical protein [Izhakiella capsodis]|uniref:hypothetical protein n=1 Tax=Izhakiella capsodis TaxID=1367852 RepID=UPI000B86639E|nr:hypothetical protein [Izhakiella capsodis]